MDNLTQIMTCVQENHPISVPPKTKDDILIFFKLYDPEKEELRLFLSLVYAYSYLFI